MPQSSLNRTVRDTRVPGKGKQILLAQQRSWAVTRGLKVDVHGYLDSVESNLWRPLSSGTNKAFSEADGSELVARPGGLPKMCALHSSSALAVNFFDYWTEANPTALVNALDCGADFRVLEFEVKYPTGLGGKPPNLDVVLVLKSGLNFAIESKFCEWLALKRPKKSVFKDKYFSSCNIWARHGLRASQALAARIRQGSEWFWYLDAPQLLKHALGLATHLKERFSLCYLYYDADCAEGEQHREEVRHFEAHVGAELRFRAMTYQELFGRLQREASLADRSYLEYLSERYFPSISITSPLA